MKMNFQKRPSVLGSHTLQEATRHDVSFLSTKLNTALVFAISNMVR